MAKSSLKRRPSSQQIGLPSLQKQMNKKLSYSMLETEPTEDFNLSHSLSTLYRLRHRTTQSRPKLTPELASYVIKNYLLPLFEPGNRPKKLTLDRSNSELLQAVPGTVYGELRLSSVLSDKIEELKRDLTYNSQLLRDCLQEKEAAVRSMEQDRERLLQLETECRLVRFSLSQITRTAQASEQKMGLLAAQIGAYKKMFETSEAEKKQLASLLHESKATIDKLKNQSLQLEHGNMLLKLENSVIGERLKGLYATLESISYRKGEEDIVKCELTLLGDSLVKLTNHDSGLLDELQSLLNRRDELMDMNVMLVNLRNDDHADKTKLAISMRDKILQLQSELSSMNEERDGATLALEKNERKMKEIFDENQRLRLKMKNNRLKRKANEASDQICKVCQKIYNEAENYNWSCRTHFGDFGGEMWWCCGKAGREAPGCKVAKHISKEDEDLEDPEDTSEKQNAATICSSCKDIGHKHTECPKDPNIRSKQDLDHELKRIHDIRERKKMALMGMESHEMMKSLFEDKFGKTAFGVTGEGKSEGSSDNGDQGNEPEKEVWETYLDQFRLQPKKNLVKIDTSLSLDPPLRGADRINSTFSEF